MRKRDLLSEIVIITLFVTAVLAIFVMLGMALRSKSDAEVHQIMADAEERIERYQAANASAKERPKLSMVTYAPLETPTIEPVEDWYIESIPLGKQLQKVVFEESCKNGVDYFTALGLIQVESDFQLDAVNARTGCYGLCQLHPGGFSTGLTPEQNIEAGMEYLGQLLERYDGDVQAALTAYNAGYDTGIRWYARAVLEAAEAIMDAAGVVTK